MIIVPLLASLGLHTDFIVRANNLLAVAVG